MRQPTPRPRSAGIPAVTRQAIAKAVREGLGQLRARPHQRLGDWAREHFVLSGDSSHKKGRWDAWPFQVGMLDMMGSDDIEELDVMKSKRVGYTKCLVASIAYDASHRPRKQAIYQPTDEDRDSFVKSEVRPAIDEVPAVAASRRERKATEETVRYIQFRATVAHFLGGNSERNYRRITVSSVKMDEIDGFPQQVQKAGDPVTRARGRMEGAAFPKLIIGGTPRVKGLSHIERRVGLAQARMRFRITCPHCKAEHPLLWGGDKVPHGFKWEPENPDSVRHVCPHCRGSIGQADYLRVWREGAWVCDITGLRYGADRVWRDDRGELARPPAHVGLHGLWSAYSPQRSWPDIVTEFLAARQAQVAGDDGPMMVFKNETLAEVWEEQFEQTEADALRRRAQAEGLPMGVVPAGGVVVLASVDVQGDRWEYVARAVGRGAEAWTIDYRVIYGNTADRAEWDAKVAPLRHASYPHAHGARVRISGLAIDTGFQTQIAYDFCRAYKADNVHAVKGDGALGLPIKGKRKLMDISLRGRAVRKGVALWHVGIDSAKDLLHGRLELDAGSGAGRQHFAAQLPDSFFRGLTAEKRVPVRTLRGLEHRWQCPSGVRNEPLDCTVYTMFLEELLELGRWTDLQWQRAEAALHPDLFDQVVADSLPALPGEAPADAAADAADADGPDDAASDAADLPAELTVVVAVQPPEGAIVLQPAASADPAALVRRPFVPPTPPRAAAIASSDWSSRL